MNTPKFLKKEISVHLDLPETWTQVKNAELFTLQKGKNPKDLSQSKKKYAYLDIEALDRGNVRRYSEDEKAPKCTDSDILVVCDGSRSGLILKGQNGIVGSTLAIIETPPFIQDFVRILFLENFEELNSTMKGAAIPHLDTKKMLQDSIGLPPLPEQKAIVKTVEELFEEVEQLEQLAVKRVKLKEDFAVSALRRLIEEKAEQEWPFVQTHFHSFFNEEINIKKLRETILQLAVQGKLTSKWRQSKTILPPKSQLAAPQNSKSVNQTDSPSQSAAPGNDGSVRKTDSDSQSAAPQKRGAVRRTEGSTYQNKTTPALAQEKLNNLPHLKTFRKNLRKNMTPAEATLWKILKGKNLGGRKFRRQHSVGNYILDFYCPSEKLAIELDGQGHFEEDQKKYDEERDLFLEYFGIKVLRFENKWVWDNQAGVLQAIQDEFGWTQRESDRVEESAGVYRIESGQAEDEENLPPRPAGTPPSPGGELEHAADLLVRIKAETEKLVKEKKIKKEKPLPPIAEDEIPYELPEGWVWCRFMQIARISSNLVNPIEFEALPHIAPNNIQKNTSKLLKYQTIREDRVTSAKHLFFSGQILYSKIRPNLDKVIKVDFEGLCSADMYPITPYISTEYLLNYMLSREFLSQSVKSDTRIAMPKINQQDLSVILVPLPPLEEQKVIVAKVNSLMKLCDELIEHVKQNKQQAENLMQSVLREVFEE